jgi:predicted nucleotidyltransferase
MGLSSAENVIARSEATKQSLLPSAEQLRPIAERYGLKLIVLFGSQAQGHTHPESDVDIAVLSAKPLTGSRRLELWSELTKIFEADVDLTSLDRAEPLLLYRVACTGISLYEGEKWAWENQKSYGCRRYWDSRKFFEAMERYVSGRAEEMRRAG